MLLFENESYHLATTKYIVPIPILCEHIQLIKGKTEEEQNEILEQLAKEIPTLYPKRENPLEGREDIIRCMQKIPVMRDVNTAYDPVTESVLKEIAQRTEGKSEDETMHILNQYTGYFEQRARGIDIDVDTDDLFMPVD